MPTFPSPPATVAAACRRPGRPARSRRLAWSTVLTGLALAGCGGGSGEVGLAESQGVPGAFCDALDRMITTYDETTGPDYSAAAGDGRALLEILPDDVPGTARQFFEAMIEMAELSPVWEKPEGGIKDEYLDDFDRLGQIVFSEKALTAAAYTQDTCPALPSGPDGSMRTLFTSEVVVPPASPGQAAPASPPPAPAEALTLLDDGPDGIYEQVTLDIAAVMATDAEAAEADAADPQASGRTVLLVDIEATTDASVGNDFNADDFRLVDPAGTTVTAESILDANGALGSLQLRGRDSTRGTLVFPTDSLVTDLAGYQVRVERDDRVPAVLAFDGGGHIPYPIALDAGATGRFRMDLTAACSDDYETRVVEASAGLDADVGTPEGIVRSPRQQRWIRVVLELTNVTSQGSGTNASVCHAFSGHIANAELRLDADGRATAPANDKDFAKIEPGTTGERPYVFPVDAGARALTLLGPGGETLGSWTVDLPPAAGEG